VAIVPEAEPRAERNPGTGAAIGAAPAQMPLHADRPGDAAPPPSPAPAVIALARTDEATLAPPATSALPTPVIAAAPSASRPGVAVPSPRDARDATRARTDQEARERAGDLAKVDPARQEGQQQAEQLDAARQEIARQEAARAENARLEVERQEAAMQAADLQEAARQVATQQEAAQIEAAQQAADLQQAAGQEAARQEAARAEAARAEAARAEAARAEAARAEAARAEAARAEAAREAAARREAALRAIGRQLDEEAARREAATAAARQAPSSSSARRYWLFGRTDPNAELILYAEAWSRKIQLNMTFDMVREAAKQPHSDPLVTVAIRSDGSVEAVTFVQSSGVPALDEAIRRVVDSQKPYPVFPPGLAREFDVIEIRRTWYFDMAIRLY
jgi:TolA protein